MNRKTGVLHIVATPIGHLGDLSPRAAEVLRRADLVLAEDTRQSGILMRHYNIRTSLRSFHQHNEKEQIAPVLRELAKGACIALISDAGTPLISDPGYLLVREVRKQGFRVSPIPGPCALIAALSASGLPTDRFVFEGFVPAKDGARKTYLQRVATEESTIVMYESCHRMMATLEQMSELLGPARTIVIGREISKKFETFYHGSSGEVLVQLMAGPAHQRGEFVIMVSGAPGREPDEVPLQHLLMLLLGELPVKSASRIAANWLGIPRNRAYTKALELERERRKGSSSSVRKEQ